MKTDHIAQILNLVKEKYKIDVQHDWSEGSSTYFREMKKEIEEVEEELEVNRKCYLEEELGDVLWDYFNLLYNLEVEGKVELSEVFRRALQKYEERMAAIGRGETWSTVKELQKKRLAEEQAQIGE